jgi:hypothetical protein
MITAMADGLICASPAEAAVLVDFANVAKLMEFHSYFLYLARLFDL